MAAGDYKLAVSRYGIGISHASLHRPALSTSEVCGGEDDDWSEGHFFSNQTVWRLKLHAVTEIGRMTSLADSLRSCAAGMHARTFCGNRFCKLNHATNSLPRELGFKFILRNKKFFKLQRCMCTSSHCCLSCSTKPLHMFFQVAKYKISEYDVNLNNECLWEHVSKAAWHVFTFDAFWPFWPPGLWRQRKLTNRFILFRF